MSRIKILPEILSNKIAAGEVVERPSSVLKELVENSLDAHATRINIEVEKGGRELLSVGDNGSGMGRDDALLCLERYATSKIKTDADLFSIHTLGFRGEAIPSIASVSRMTIITRARDNDIGTRIEIHGGKIKRVMEAGAPKGTLIIIKDLFYNTPARRKFLKTQATEMGHITDTITGMALGWPGVGFELKAGNRNLVSWPPAKDARTRVLSVLSPGLDTPLIKVEYEEPSVNIFGWVASPQYSKATRQGIFTFVNGRRVFDKVVNHALMQGFSGRLMKGKYPLAVLNLFIPENEVDVNVHPAKAVVRFARQSQVHDAVQKAIIASLENSNQGPWAVTPGQSHTEQKPDFSPDRQPFIQNNENSLINQDGSVPASASRAIKEAVHSGFSWPEKELAQKTENTSWEFSSDPPVQENLPIKGEKKDRLYPIGQIHNTYILAENNEGLVIIDQHAAHERVLYERFMVQIKKGLVQVQNLLIPQSFELSHTESRVLTDIIPELYKNGLEIEKFSGRTFVIKAVPDFLSETDVLPLIKEIVEKAVENGYSGYLEKALESIIILMACHGAIRANEPLNTAAVKELLKELAECENPSQCPHGRPTMLAWSITDMEKGFKRK